MNVEDMANLEGPSMVSAVKMEKSCSLGSQGKGRNACLAKANRAKSEYQGAEYELVGYESLPKFLRHNEFILGYYRSEWPLRESLLSIFSIHNETLNVWTHLIGFLIFLALTICTASMMPTNGGVPSQQHSAPGLLTVDGLKMVQYSEVAFRNQWAPKAPDFQKVGMEQASRSSSTGVFPLLPTLRCTKSPSNSSAEGFFPSNHTEHHGVKNEQSHMRAQLPAQRITRWPFVSFLCGAMFCLLTSSACHLLSCHSELVSYLMLRLDYAGISALIVTSFYPLVYYAFLCDPYFSNLYITSITIFGVATVVVSLLPVFETPEFRVVRAGLFFCMGVSGLVPIIHKVILFNRRPEALHTTLYEMMMGAFYGLGVLIYATRLPERWKPGKFDLVGHSHQLFHVLVVAGAYMHYLAGLVYLHWRDLESC